MPSVSSFILTHQRLLLKVDVLSPEVDHSGSALDQPDAPGRLVAKSFAQRPLCHVRSEPDGPHRWQGKS